MTMRVEGRARRAKIVNCDLELTLGIEVDKGSLKATGLLMMLDGIDGLMVPGVERLLMITKKI